MKEFIDLDSREVKDVLGVDAWEIKDDVLTVHNSSDTSSSYRVVFTDGSVEVGTIVKERKVVPTKVPNNHKPETPKPTKSKYPYVKSPPLRTLI